MLTPNEWRQMAEDSGDNTLMMARIDKALRYSSMPCRIAVSVFQDYNGDLQHVLASYRLLGWKVEWVYDSRDGDYIEMSL